MDRQLITMTRGHSSSLTQLSLARAGGDSTYQIIGERVDVSLSCVKYSIKLGLILHGQLRSPCHMVLHTIEELQLTLWIVIECRDL